MESATTTQLRLMPQQSQKRLSPMQANTSSQEIVKISARVRIVSGQRQRQCIGPKMQQRSIHLGLCRGEGKDSKGWLAETSEFFAQKPTYRKGPNGRIKNSPDKWTFQARCKFCDKARVEDRYDAVNLAESTQSLPEMSDEELATLAQQVPAQRQAAFELLMKRTEAMRANISRNPIYSKGYSLDDTLANTMEGVLWAVYSFDVTKGAKFTTHAATWCRKMASNRELKDQPLFDQWKRADGAKDDKGDKIYRRKAINIAVVSGASSMEDDSGEACLDHVAGGTRDEDQTAALDIREKIEDLPDDEKEIVVKHFFESQPITEIADDMGIQSNDAERRLKSALSRLNWSLQGYGGYA